MSILGRCESHPLTSRSRVFSEIVFLFAAAILVAACSSEKKDKKTPSKNEKSAGGTISITSDGVFVRQNGRSQVQSPPPQGLEQEQLGALGYLTGYQPAVHEGGVTINDQAKAHRGYNLYTSGHFTGAILMDMKGETLHKWEFDPRSEFIVPLHLRKRVMGAKYVRRAHLFPNGDLLVLFDFVGLAKIDKDSKKIWAKNATYHHDIFVHHNGDIYTLDETTRDGSVLGLDQRIIDNSIVVLSPNGVEKKRVSLADCFARSLSEKEIADIFSAPFMAREPRNDMFHTNSIEVLGEGLTGGHAALEQGNVLISIRTISTIAVIDIEKETVELQFRGDWMQQHEARSQPSGSILFFDNNGKETYSRIIEIDPKTMKRVWTYVAEPPTSFYSRLQGTVERLQNGNTLVVESNWGRAFELDAQKEKVWEFESPHRSVENSELIAVLFDMERIASDFPLAWARESAKGRSSE
jgi:hypothetical protein